MDSIPQTSRLILPGAGSPILRNIKKTWNIHDASLAGSFELYPHGEHSANQWSPPFQLRLERVVKLTTKWEKDQIMQQLRKVVYYRRQGNESRLLCATVGDLETLCRRILRTKIWERHAIARLTSQERHTIQQVKNAGRSISSFHPQYRRDDIRSQGRHSSEIPEKPPSFFRV
jgi:hypothetical protein